MLKSVVEHEDVIRMRRKRLPRSGNAMGILQMGNVRQPQGQLAGLVVRPPPLPSIPAADKRDAAPGSFDLLRNPGDERRFAGAAERQIANADDRRGDALNAGGAPVVAAIPPGNRPPHWRVCEPCDCAKDCRPERAPLAADDFAKAARIEQRHEMAVGLCGKRRFVAVERTYRSRDNL
jgi:hypothetical protein